MVNAAKTNILKEGKKKKLEIKTIGEVCVFDPFFFSKK
jgi:hypothetical protein